MKRGRKSLLIILCVVFFVVFLFSGYKVFTILKGYKSAESQYSDLNNKFVTVPSPSPSPKTVTAADPTPALPEVERSPIDVNFGQLRESWPDITGWLYSEGTVLNYPIAHDPDDTENEKYLYNFIDGTYNGSGTIFIDYRCAGDFSDYVTILYGHHMNDGSMFASLVKYAEQAYFDEHPSMYLNTPDGNYRVDIFSSYVTDADGTTYTYYFPDQETYGYYLDAVTRWSYIDTGVSVTPEDRIIVMSTCTYEYDNARFVVLGKLVPLEPVE